MKIASRILSIVLGALLALGLFSPMAAAAEPAGGELKVLSYNVAGLPGVISGRTPKADHKLVSQFFAGSGYDIIGVQEDFNYHTQLLSQIKTAYPHRTIHQGGVPVGDGLNVLSKFPVYNQQRVTWNKSSGVFTGSSDELTPKGFLRTVVRLAPGAYTYVYVLHADAGRDEASKAARRDNLSQLAHDINENAKGQAVIVMGDANCIYSGDDGDYLCNEVAGNLRDSWFELTEQGIYAGTNPFEDHRTRETGDSIDHIYVRNGGGITFRALESKNLVIQTTPDGVAAAEHEAANGRSLSDHAAKFAKLGWSYDGTPSPFENPGTDGALAAPRWHFGILWTQAKSFFRVLFRLPRGVWELATGK